MSRPRRSTPEPTKRQHRARAADDDPFTNDHFREYLDRVCTDSYLIVERTRRILEDSRALSARTTDNRRAAGDAVAASAAWRDRRVS